MLVDIHAHVQFSAFREDADEVIRRAIEAGVKMIAPSSEIRTARRAIDYAEKYPDDIWAAVGLHPIHLKAVRFDGGGEDSPAFETYGARYDEAEWRPLAEHPRTVALGEVGLDYVDRLLVSEEDRALQEATYRQQLDLALELKKPVIQHCRSGPVAGKPRDAHDDALAILADYIPRGLRGVAHCYSGTLEQARRYLELGFSLSFTGLITYNAAWDEVIREAPLEHVMVETDIPYMTPVPHRGKRNEPTYVRYVAEHIAGLKGVSAEEVAAQTTENAKRLFALPI
ncbi:MAG: TatD family hydrolase [Candidatus Terrybacteria bacterium]|nr:TatD family hydrolase [Candidatus Terrybacteria bacterium]